MRWGACPLAALALLTLMARPGASQVPPSPGSDFAIFQDPIAKLEASLSLGTTGAKNGAPMGTPSANSSYYQRYANGVIYYHPNFGAAWIYPKVVSDLWEQNKASLGPPERSSVAYPAAGDMTSCAKLRQAQGTMTYFGGGGIVYSSGAFGGPFVVSGPTYIRYLQMEDAFGSLGPRVSNNKYSGPGKGSAFLCGWIVEAAGSDPYKPAYVLMASSAIAKAHQGIGTSGALSLAAGDPVGNEDTVPGLGLVQRFTWGVIWYSVTTGVQFVKANMPDPASNPGRISLLEDYESVWGGPKGVLGMPTSSIKTIWVKSPVSTATVALYALDCAKGVIVFYPAVPGVSTLPWGSTQVFTGLSVFLSSFKTYGCDTITCSDQDPWFGITMTVNTGGSKTLRLPSSGYYNNNPNVVFNSDKGLVVSKVTSATIISLTFKATDYDSISSNDALGTVSNSLSIATGWGAWAGLFNTRSSDFRPEYSIKRAANSILLKPQWRYNYQWAFKNFKTATLTEDQMADTFSDIGRDEFVLAHPFHALFYTFVYKTLANTGNCFGMALSSTYAQVGKSPYPLPLGDYGPAAMRNGGCICNGCGSCSPTSNMVSGQGALVNHINTLHGYQLNCIVGLKGLEMYKKMLQTKFNVLNGHLVFNDAESRHKQGDPQLLTMMGDMVGHAIRAYKFARSKADSACTKVGVSTCHIMYIADPNKPYTSAEAANPDQWKLVVHPSSGRWYYDSKYNNLEATNPRYALMNVPFSWVSYRGPSIVDDIPWGTLFDIGMLMLFGDADIESATDGTGKALGAYDSAITRFPMPTDILINPGVIGLISSPPRFYAVRRYNGALQQPITIRVKPRGNFTLALKTSDGSFQLSSSKGDGTSDVVTLSGFDTSPSAQTFSVTPGSAKGLGMTLAAPSRAFGANAPLVYALQNLAGGKSEKINAALLNAGQALQVGSGIVGKQLSYNLLISRGVTAEALAAAQKFSSAQILAGQVNGALLVPKILPQISLVGGG